MKNLVFLFILFISFPFVTAKSSTPKEEACCICQTGNHAFFPAVEKGFFKAGCHLWLAGKKNCQMKKVLPHDSRSVREIPRQCNGKLVKMGFVGHWSSTNQSSKFLTNAIIRDGMLGRKMSFEIENTACYGMASPKTLLDNKYYYGKDSKYYMERLADDQYFTYKANQVLSVGMWEGILPGDSNLWAKYDSRTDKVEYPACEDFENHSCTASFKGIQYGQNGHCRTNNGDLKKLECCSARVEMFSRDFSSRNTRVISKNMWLEPDQCGTLLH